MIGLPEIRFNGKTPFEMSEAERLETAMRLVIRGKAYEYGHTEIPQDFGLATSTYKQAADLDGPDCLFHLSKLYLKRCRGTSDDQGYIREDIALTAFSYFAPEIIKAPEVAFAFGLLFEHVGLRALQNPAARAMNGDQYLSWAATYFYRGSVLPDAHGYDARAKCAKAHKSLNERGYGAEAKSKPTPVPLRRLMIRLLPSHLLPCLRVA
ncbi:MAG: hypothetical protein WC521_00640 [Bdellovibrionales bacterium]